MGAAKGSEGLVKVVAALLEQPVGDAYPMPDDEDAASWRAASLDALAALWRRGTLDAVAADGETLGHHLLAFTESPLLADLAAVPGRVRLVGETVRNIAYPGRINQGLKGTCAVTCVEIFVAERLPAEYVRYMVGLASPEGGVALKGGDPLQRDEVVMQWHTREGDRSPASRLMQVAFMEFAYPELDYQNMVDGHIERADNESKNTGTGVGLDEFDRLLEAVTGERWDTVSEHQSKLQAKFARLGIDTSFLPDIYRDGITIIRRVLAADDACFVTIGTRDSDQRVGQDPLLALPHKVRVLKIDDEEGRVHYDDPLDPEDPWMPGLETRVETDEGRCSMSYTDFEELLCEVSYRPQHAEGVVEARAD